MAKKKEVISISVLNEKGDIICPICEARSLDNSKKTFDKWSTNICTLLKSIAEVRDAEVKDVCRPRTRRKV